ncbi:hypothetical protein COCNU_scaffold032179G000010 [Cocos nucifera]|nr:hypothetical protein [Cocos nucifera]
MRPNGANSSPLTPLGFLQRTATVYGDRPSVVYHRTVFTWSQTRHRCLRLASSLSSLGISRGDVVSVLAPNVPAMYEMHFGVPMSGAILNTINLRLDARTISVLLHHSDSKLVFVDPLSLPLLRDALRLLPRSHQPPRVVPIEDPYEENAKSSDLSAAGCGLTYEKLIEMGDPEFKWVRPKSEWDPMVLNYTSGTTSAPKGVVHCHRGLYVVTVDSLIDWSVSKRPVYLWTLPMFHANGWSYPWGIAAAGGTNVCLRRFDAATIYAALATHRVTHMCGAPVVLNMLANAPASARKPLSGPVQILTGGAPPPAAVLHRVEALGFSVGHGATVVSAGFGSYFLGMSETVANDFNEANTKVDTKEPSLGWMVAFLFIVSFIGLFSVVPMRKITDWSLNHLLSGNKSRISSSNPLALVFCGPFRWFYTADENCGFKAFPTLGLEAYK